MNIITYDQTPDRAHWLAELRRADWEAGALLCRLLDEGTLAKELGDGAEVLLLTDGDRLVSYCTLAPYDDVWDNLQETPWIGFVYTFPAYRGQRCAGQLLAHCEQLAAQSGRKFVYISTPHIGLYEKYGYAFHRRAADYLGNPCRVYRREVS
mgnify:CR=1 FL=1